MVNHFKVYPWISYLSLVFLFFSIQGLEAGFYEDKARGWFWYEDPFLEEEDDVKEIKKENLLPESLPAEPNYGKQLQQYKKSLEDKKAKALMSPTYSHVKDYMVAQKDMSDRASVFSEQWQRVVLTNPSLNPEVKNPTSQVMRHVKNDEERTHKEELLSNVSKRYGLFLFVSSNCAYCKAFAPIVNVFSKKYGFEVMVIQTRGLVDSDIEQIFPKVLKNNGMVEAFGIEGTPALMAYSAQDDDLIPVSFGATTLDVLESNMMAFVDTNTLSDVERFTKNEGGQL